MTIDIKIESVVLFSGFLLPPLCPIPYLDLGLGPPVPLGPLSYRYKRVPGLDSDGNM